MIKEDDGDEGAEFDISHLHVVHGARQLFQRLAHRSDKQPGMGNRRNLWNSHFQQHGLITFKFKEARGRRIHRTFPLLGPSKMIE